MGSRRDPSAGAAHAERMALQQESSCFFHARLYNPSRAPSKFFNSSIIKESEKALAFFIEAC
jgi:hypothetical protein